MRSRINNQFPHLWYYLLLLQLASTANIIHLRFCRYDPFHTGAMHQFSSWQPSVIFLQVVQNSPEPIGSPPEHTKKSQNMMRTCSRSQIAQRNIKATNQTHFKLNELSKLLTFKLMPITPNHV